MRTRLTERFGLTLPLIQAPMAFVAGGALAAAVSRAGGLGLIGGGYGDRGWIEDQFAIAGDMPVGCGFISFALDDQPDLLETVLMLQPRALFLSFADPAPFLATVRKAGVPVICQVQTFRDACHAIDLGVDVVVAQGGDAGGHGQSRGTMAFVPEVADEIARRRSETLLCAAGGIADGRGLVAAIALGADGVVVGTRFWGAAESLVDRRLIQTTLAHTGDDTVRTRVIDTIRRIDWPERYSGRVLRTAFVDRWTDDEAGLRRALPTEEQRWQTAVEAADTSIVAPFVGEAVGLVDTEQSASDIIASISAEAQGILDRRLGLS
ncbi:nitronate monooxygenase [Nitratireductor rhodophyticola]|uniref:NAD(P)H-dependent flavin oxidoreductase n=1 Tax=Nitratireductor rhodophyticola TaxID=2854036 RepID=UPI0008141277|nr:nitronate monooxygenase [Nitratireductor rhodophyticola]MEC9245473.1 nitronate monooxygenase [Pseudomonadota bacterium]WPZ13983.1 nitronate monooxygenase [Nitratireductor rhodophyticola]